MEHSDEVSAWIKYIKLRIKANKNFIGFTSGPTGSGKSWTCLRIAEVLDKRFTIDNVVFGGEELMALVNSDKLRKGSVIIFEEAGVGMSNRNWYSLINKMLNYLLQTFRHRNFILLMNAPYMDFVDSATRKLFHAELQLTSRERNTDFNVLRAQLIQYNARYQKFYYKNLRVKQDGHVIKIKMWKVGKPSKELIDEYEVKKRAYTDKLNQEIEEQLKNKKGKKKEKPEDNAVCNKCGYTWHTKKAIPPFCKHCKSTDTMPIHDNIIVKKGENI